MIGGWAWERHATSRCRQKLNGLEQAFTASVNFGAGDGPGYPPPPDLSARNLVRAWVEAAGLRAGQRLVVAGRGERIAADGEVLSGQSAVDRSMMTGESVPVDAARGTR